MVSNLTRKMKHESIRRAYKKFCEQFALERDRRMNTHSNLSNDQEAEELLGRKPTFKQWLDRTHELKIAAKEKEDIDQKIEDLDWED